MLKGRPRQHPSNAERQSAYRERRRAEFAALQERRERAQEDLRSGLDRLDAAIMLCARLGDGDALTLQPHCRAARIHKLAQWFEERAAQLCP